MPHLLEVKNLVTKFHTEEGIVHAVNGISYTLDEGESLGIVGESGSGKTVGVLSITGLIPSPPGRVVDGKALFKGHDLLQLSKKEIRFDTALSASFANRVANSSKTVFERRHLHV